MAGTQTTTTTTTSGRTSTTNLIPTRPPLPPPTTTRSNEHITREISRVSTPPTPHHEPLFPLFPALPTEIRLQIWATVLSTRRSIQITYSPIYERFSSKASPPTVLSVNRESRQYALTHLLKIPGCIQPHLFTLSQLPPAPPIYFLPEVDILYVISKDKWTLMNTISNFPDEIRRRVRNLCVLYTCQVQSIQHSLRIEAPVLMTMPALVSVWVVQYMKPELNRPWGSEWVSGDMLELVFREGSGREVVLDGWDGLVKETEVRTKDAVYWVGGGTGVGMPVGRVMCWHGVKRW